MFARTIQFVGVIVCLTTCIASSEVPTARVARGFGHHHHFGHHGLKGLGAGLLGLEAANLARDQELYAFNGFGGYNGLGFGGFNGLGFNRGLTDVQSLLLLNEIIAKLLASLAFNPGLTVASPLGLGVGGNHHATAAAAVATTAREAGDRETRKTSASVVAPETTASVSQEETVA